MLSILAWSGLRMYLSLGCQNFSLPNFFVVSLEHKPNKQRKNKSDPVDTQALKRPLKPNKWKSFYLKMPRKIVKEEEPTLSKWVPIRH